MCSNTDHLIIAFPTMQRFLEQLLSSEIILLFYSVTGSIISVVTHLTAAE